MRRHLPNQLTMLRLVLAAAFFITLTPYRFGDGPQTALIFAAIALFILAALTDFLDGHLARKWNVESRFGRIMDPFCDKVLILGAFICLAGPGFDIPSRPAQPDPLLASATGVYPWMVVIILARELLVTGIRGELEAAGVKFGAVMIGKLKMVLQSFAVPLLLLAAWLDPTQHDWLLYAAHALAAAVVLVTILSGIPYIRNAKAAMAKLDTPPSDD